MRDSRHLLPTRFLLALVCAVALPACRDCEDLGDVQPQGAIVPAIFDFGPITVGSTCTANLKVTNRGQVDLSVSGSSLDNDAQYTLSKVPSLVRIGADEGAVGELQAANIELQSDDPDDEGILRGVVTAIVTDAPAPAAKSTCASVGGEDTTPCTSMSYGAVQLNGAGLVLPITITNDGTADMTVTAAVINGGNADFTVESVTRGTTQIELPTTVLPGRSADCGAASGADNTITINVRYTPTALGADVDTLLVLTDAVNLAGGNIEVALDGEGSDTGIIMNPDFLNFGALGEGDADTIDVLVKNVGTLDASVNFSCIDLENDDVCDAECTGDADDNTLSGSLSCIVTTVDGGVSGKGFVLSPTDGAAGGDDERIVSVTWAPIAGATTIPATAVLALHSNILGNRVFTAPIQGGTIGILQGSAGADSACPDEVLTDVCVLADGTPGAANYTTWAGQATVVLTNTGEASVTIASARIDGDSNEATPPNTIDDDYTITNLDDIEGAVIAPGDSIELLVSYDEVAPGNDAVASSELTNVVIEHNGAGAVTIITLDVIPPT
jgi:hypothetical protein